MRLSCAAMVGFAFSFPASADVLRVPQQFPTVQSAVTAAATGDEVLIAPGTYQEHVAFSGKTVHLRGDGPADTIVIDGTGSGRVLKIENAGEVMIEDLTIANGASEMGAGILVIDASLALRGVIIRDNTAFADPGSGGGIEIRGGSLAADNCVFERNTATTPPLLESGVPQGGAICGTGDVLLVDCEFLENSALVTQGPKGGRRTVGDGGAIHLDPGGSFLAVRCLLTGSSAGHGGAIDAPSTDIVLADCEFRWNRARASTSSGQGKNNSSRQFGEGGAVRSGGVLALGCRFTRNQAGSGGALFASVVDASDCEFLECSGGGGGCCPGGVCWGDGEGGAVRAITISLARCRFVENRSSSGGAVWGRGTIRQCEFEANSVWDPHTSPGLGGAVFLNGGLIFESMFLGNHCGGTGGAVFSRSGATIASTTFIENGRFTRNGGAVGTSAPLTVTGCLFIANTGGSGSACYATQTARSVSLSNCTFVAHGEQVVVQNDRQDRVMEIASCIFWSNAGEAISGNTEVVFSLVEGGFPGDGNIDADPLFVDPDGPDDDPMTYLDNNYRLATGSPAIDSGSNDRLPDDMFDVDHDEITAETFPIDLAGLPRRVDDPRTQDSGQGDAPVVDMGAFEFQVQKCLADINRDGLLDNDDFFAFLDAIATGDVGVCDLNGDARCDAADFFEFLDVFANGCQ